MKSAAIRVGSIARVLVCALALFGASSMDAQLRRITVGSNPAGTNYYAVASGIAKVLQEETGIPATVRPFSGSSVYIPMLQRGEVALGINTQIDTYVAYSGQEPYGVPMNNLRLIAALMPLLDNFAVRADAGIVNVADLEGRRVVVAIRSNVSLERWHWGLLASGGLGPDDVEEITVASLPDGTRLLTEGRADAVPIGMDTALVRQADATIPGGIRFIAVGGEEDRLLATLPGSLVQSIDPESGSVGILEPTRVGRFDSYLNSGVHLSDDDAYLIASTIHEQWESLREDYPLLRSVSPDMLAPTPTPHPYHPGAARYYREAGLWTDAHERNQSQVLAAGDR